MNRPISRISGKVITFYSFKGGTGRTQVLANVAFLLACQGKRVCAIDWDLEAPGLHRYFHPFLADPNLSASEGLIDFLWTLSSKALTKKGSATGRSSDVDILDYVVRIDWEFEGAGLLDFLPAGRQGLDYPGRATSFQWDTFYERLGGGRSLEAARSRLVSQYDYVLIDSRTGISDTSGVCTVQMPDQLVACFTLNRQSIEGVSTVLDSVTRLRKDRKLPIFPIEMRVENSEKFKLESVRRFARPVFEKFLSEPSLEYWEDMEISYWPFYAFEECLAVFGDDSGTRSRSSMIAAMERVAKKVSGLPEVRAPRIEPSERNRILRAYSLSNEVIQTQSVLRQDAGGDDVPTERSRRAEEVWAEIEAYYFKWSDTQSDGEKPSALEDQYSLLPSRLLSDSRYFAPVPERLLRNPQFMLFLATSRDARIRRNRSRAFWYIFLAFVFTAGLTVGSYQLVHEIWVTVAVFAVCSIGTAGIVYWLLQANSRNAEVYY